MVELTFAVAPFVVKPVNDLYDLIKDKVSQKLDEQAIKKIQTTLTGRIESVQKVKTIYKGDSAINLMEFYYPTKVEVNKRINSINFIGEINIRKNLVIQGTVGQGKSIFMRYMTSQEIKMERRIPVFFELRTLSKSETLEQAMMTTLKKWLFEIDDKTFKILAESGKLVFFLDGFDEIPSDQVKDVIRELEHWSEQYPDLQIIVSSRPDSGIEVSTYFDVVKLTPYEKDDQLGLIKKLIEDEESFLEVSKTLKASSLDVQHLLRTPLMVTLFVMTYRAKQIIPESMSDFYENIFQVLMYRHDKTKPGFTRELKSSLNEKQLQEVFEYFCFLTKNESLLSFNRQKFMELLQTSLEKTDHTNQDSSKVLQDISKALCLIIQDGIEYSFIHKSIQEFFVASFIKHSAESKAKNFYSIMKSKYSNFEVELVFLENIDTYRYYKFLLIPELTLIAEHYKLDTSINLSTLIENIFIVRKNEDELILIKPVSDQNDFKLSWGEHEVLMIIMRLPECLTKSGVVQNRLDSLMLGIMGNETNSLRKTLRGSQNFQNKIKSLLNELSQAKNYVASKEDNSIFDGI